MRLIGKVVILLTEDRVGDGTISSVGAVHTTVGAIPSFGVVPTTVRAVTTTIGAVTPTVEAVLTSVAAIPAAVGFVPTSISTVPTIGYVPTSVGAVPTSIGAIPTSIGAVPNSIGAVPTSVGAVPTSVGAVPTSVGAVPTSVGVIPNSVGAFPTSVGAFPTPIGALPTVNIINGVQSTITGQPVNGASSNHRRPSAGNSINNGRTVVKKHPQSKPRSGSRARKPYNLVVGQKVNDGILSIRGADLTVSLYVGQIDNSYEVNDMKTFIEGQNVKVVELEELARKHNRFKSFRLCIRKKDLDSIKDPNFWPEGIVVRRFFRKQNADGGAMQPVSS